MLLRKAFEINAGAPKYLFDILTDYGLFPRADDAVKKHGVLR